MSELDPRHGADFNESQRTAPERSGIRGIGRLIAKLIQLVGTVLVVVGVIGLKVAARNNGEIGAIVAVIGIGIFLVVSAASILRVLWEDLRRERPSPVVGGVKLAVGGAIGLMAYFGFSTEQYPLGLMTSVPYGWQRTLPHAIAIGLGMWGVITGLFSFLGRRPNRWVLWLGLGAIVVGLGFGLPAASPIVHRKYLTWKSAEKLAMSVDGKTWATVLGSYGMGSEIAVYESPVTEIVHFDGDATKETQAIALSPDAQELARIDGGKLVTCETRTGKKLMETVLQADTIYSAQLSYSDDGTKLGVVGKYSQTAPEESYVRWSIHDRQTGNVLYGQRCSADFSHGAVSPSGLQVVLAGDDDSHEGRIRIRHVDREEPVVDATFKTHHPIKYGCRVAWSGDSRYVLVAAADTIAMFDVANGAIVWQIETSSGSESDSIFGVAFRGDNRRILAGLGGNRVWILDASSGQPVRKFERLRSYETNWSPDGQLLITGGGGGGMDAWELRSDE